MSLSKMNFENFIADPVFDFIIMQSGAHVKRKAPVGADAFSHMYNLIDEWLYPNHYNSSIPRFALIIKILVCTCFNNSVKRRLVFSVDAVAAVV